MLSSWLCYVSWVWVAVEVGFPCFILVLECHHRALAFHSLLGKIVVLKLFFILLYSLSSCILV
jgi:hypothetical protein